MVVKLSVALYADVYPTLAKSRGRNMDCESKRQKGNALPALVEDDSEVELEQEQHCHILRAEGARRQKSISPQRRQRMRRTLALPSLSEDEEP